MVKTHPSGAAGLTPGQELKSRVPWNQKQKKAEVRYECS